MIVTTHTNTNIASFPGPTQLSVACSMVLQAMESWAGPGNEANTNAQLA